MRISASKLMLGLAGAIVLAAPFTVAQNAPPAPTFPPPVEMTNQQDHQRIMNLLGIKSMPNGPSSSSPDTYNEDLANPFPNLPDPLTLKNGQKVTTADQWWNQRRPEIVEDFDREIYGRVPKDLPKVTWEVTSTAAGMTGAIPTITKQLVGHVDNSAYPLVAVDIQVSLTIPANSTGPVPVMILFSGGGFGAPGGTRGGLAGPGAATQPGAFARGGAATQPGGRGFARGGAATQPGARGFGRGGAATQPGGRGFARGGAATQPGGRGLARGPGGARGPTGPSAQQQLLTLGWGYASLNTGSVQGDSGAGLTKGIIGLVNKGQPRKLDDWGVLRAWAWGASKALDYLETDKAVNAREVGLEGHSRWGKATIVAMAYDQRFAIAYVSSSGEGGAKLHRRKYGETVDAVAGSGEYHWMAGNFLKYAGHWDDMPVDSHELVAMCAPRPVFLSAGLPANQGDGWVDAKGTFLAGVGAGPVYKLLGKKDMGATEFGGVNVGMLDGDVAFREHDGGHTDVPNWPYFLTFASRYVKAPALTPVSIPAPAVPPPANAVP